MSSCSQPLLKPLSSSGGFRATIKFIFGALESFTPQILLLFSSSWLLARRSYNNNSRCKELAVLMLIQTLIFVSFNKVCTAQYFTWYGCLLPFAFPDLDIFTSQNKLLRFIKEPSIVSKGTETGCKIRYSTLVRVEMQDINKTGSLHKPDKYMFSDFILMIVFSLWLLSLGLWLCVAYRLEYLGESMFFELWVFSLTFFLVNIALIAALMIFVS